MSLIDQEATMSDQAFDQIAAIAISDAGLSIPRSKKALVQSRLDRRLRALRLDTVKDYIELLSDKSNGSERKELISILTTNVSSFFRENHHFEHLVSQVFPKLRNKISRGESVRIWSAGCSSGQEPYSIAMKLNTFFNPTELKNILILATDIDPGILKKAKLGRYPATEIEHLPNGYQRTHFLPEGDHSQANDQLKTMVRFRELNLHADWPMKGRFDAIFCRNVLIYFDNQQQKALWPRFHRALTDGGHLYLGHSERIHPEDTSGFKSIGATIYQKTT